MKTLKLEVGKTYRSREGEEVKIIRMGNRGWDYWNGSNGEWYYEGGKWSYSAEEHPKDLIEEVSEIRHTFTIANDVKTITIKQVGNRIVLEMVPEEKKEPKPGDVMINESGSVYIFKDVVDNGNHKYFVWFGNKHLSIGGTCLPGHPATSEEAKLLFDALKKEGKRWNPKTMEVKEITEFEHIREWAKEYLSGCYYNHERIAEIIEAYLKHKEGAK